jgi:hypothetical protein
MGALCDSTVLRGGQTSTSPLAIETRHVELSAEPKRVRIDFSIASKGGGTTCICLTIGPGDFRNLIENMIVSDHAAAMSAMSGELVLAMWTEMKKLVKEAEKE